MPCVDPASYSSNAHGAPASTVLPHAQCNHLSAVLPVTISPGIATPSRRLTFHPGFFADARMQADLAQTGRENRRALETTPFTVFFQANVTSGCLYVAARNRARQYINDIGDGEPIAPAM